MKEYKFDSDDLEAVKKGEITEKEADEAAICGELAGEFAINIAHQLDWDNLHTELFLSTLCQLIGKFDGMYESGYLDGRKKE